MDNRLKIREWNNKNRNIPPHITLILDENDMNYVPDTIITVLVKRNDGKVGRVNLSLAANDGKFKATVSTDNHNTETSKTVAVKFGWEIHPFDPNSVEYPKGDERRITPA